MSPCRTLRGESGEMCELLHTSLVVQKMQGDMELAIIYPGQSVLSFFANRSSFLIGKLLLGKLSETVVVQGNAPHNRPCSLVGHLIGNRASFLCTKAPMLRVPETNFLQGITSISGRDVSGDQTTAAASSMASTEFHRLECIFWTNAAALLDTVASNTIAIGPRYNGAC